MPIRSVLNPNPADGSDAMTEFIRQQVLSMLTGRAWEVAKEASWVKNTPGEVWLAFVGNDWVPYIQESYDEIEKAVKSVSGQLELDYIILGEIDA